MSKVSTVTSATKESGVSDEISNERQAQGTHGIGAILEVAAEDAEAVGDIPHWHDSILPHRIFFTMPDKLPSKQIYGLLPRSGR